MTFKKIAMAVALMSAVGTASAVELGLVGGGISGSNDGGLAGVTVGDKWDRFGLTAGFAQAWLSKGDQNRWTLVGSYDVYQTESFIVSGTLGYAYLNQSKNEGSAGLVGVGLEVPVSNQFSLTANYAYQFAQNADENTSVITGGVKYKF
jgi:outer membrane autotransporter protein